MTIDSPLVDSPQPILNYSIVSSDEEAENRLVLKLKVSDRNKVPVVHLKKLNIGHTFSPKKSTVNSQNAQSSLGLVTPNKRGYRREGFEKVTTPKKTDIFLSADTPTKNGRQAINIEESHTPKEISNKGTPVKRCLSDTADKSSNKLDIAEVSTPSKGGRGRPTAVDSKLKSPLKKCLSDDKKGMDEENNLPTKRGRGRPKSPIKISLSDEKDMENVPAPNKKGRGRPKLSVKRSLSNADEDKEIEKVQTPSKRGRGRPKSPVKRNLSPADDDKDTNENWTPSKKGRGRPKSPDKRNLSPADDHSDMDENWTPSKKSRGRPKSPVKRNVSPVGDDNDTNENWTPSKNGRERSESESTSKFNATLPGKRPIRTPSRYRDHHRSSPRINLDESFRRSILRGQNNKIERTPSTRRKTTQFYFEDDEEDEIEMEKQKSTKNTPKESISPRKLRTRSASSTSDFVPKTPRRDKKAPTPAKNTARRSMRTRSTSTFIDIDDISNNEEFIPKTPKNKIIKATPKRDKKITTPVKDSRRRIMRTRSTSSSIDLEETSDEEEFIPKTPKNKINKAAPKTPKSASKFTPKTPKNRAKMIREGIITPSMHSRATVVPGDRTPLMKARTQLHVSYVPMALPCREKEYCDVFSFLEGKLLDGCGGCMYISGVPGTGKTATVTSVINHLQENDDVPKFNYVSINGMRLTEPRQSYVEILKQLSGKTVSWEQAQSILEEMFTKKKNSAPVVMLVDELDILCTKRQDVVYNLLDWPTKAKNQLIVITIANTMDLPERLLMSRVTSRLGLTRLTFQAYTHKQLQEIVTKRLSGTNSFNPDAIQFVARKVASVSGDARRALDICRRAAEMAETEGKSQLVNMSHVNDALNAMITQPKVRAIKHCSRLEKFLLQSIVAEVERTGVEETTFADVFTMLVSCCALDGFKMVTSTVALSAISRLSACRLILTDQKCSNIFQRIILNVSVDDVYYALKKD